MKKAWQLLLILGLAPVLAIAQTTKTGNITTSQTWSGTVTVTGDVVISNCTVTIQPGTIIKFNTTSNNVSSDGGDATHICIVLKTNGAVNAVGTAGSPITFTSAAATKSKNLWDRIRIMENINVGQTAFTYCVFECGKNAFEFRASANTLSSPNPITIDHCEFRNIGTAAIYITSAGSPIITNCIFNDINSSGVFAHGAKDVTITNTFISNVAVGLIFSGEPTWGWNQTVTVNHVTIDSVNGARTTSPQWWTGMGVWCAGDSRQIGTLTLTNSIIANVADYSSQYGPSYGLSPGVWTVTRDYNCYYNAGAGVFDRGVLAAHEMEADPQLVNVKDPTQGLLWNSPCANAASDGSHMGAWQGTIGIHDQMPALSMVASLRTEPNPFTDRITITYKAEKSLSSAAVKIYTIHGEPVTTISRTAGANTFVWNGTDRAGWPVQPGVYYCILHNGATSLGRKMVLSGK